MSTNPMASFKSKLNGDLLAKYSYVIILLVILTLFSILTPRFFSITNLMNIGLQSSIRGILAVGMTIVIISGGIDLSVGMIYDL